MTRAITIGLLVIDTTMDRRSDEVAVPLRATTIRTTMSGIVTSIGTSIRRRAIAIEATAIATTQLTRATYSCAT